MTRVSFWAACVLSILASVPLCDAVILGVDLGNGYFKASSLRIVQGAAVIDAILNVQSKRKTHTMVGFRDQDRYYGADAYQLLPRFPMQMVTGAALLAGHSYNDTAFQSRLRDWMYPYNTSENARGGFDVTVDGNVTLSGEDLLGQIFNYLQSMTVAHINQSATGLVIAAPQHLTTAQRSSIVDAAAVAGLHVSALVPTATAAAVQWGVQRREEIAAKGPGVPTFIAIVDVGAYHAEASVVVFVPAPPPKGRAVQASLGSVRTLASASTDRVSGRLLDVALAREFIRMYKAKVGKCPPAPALQSICDGSGDGSDILFGLDPKERVSAAKAWVKLINAAEAARGGLSALSTARVALPADALGIGEDYVFQLARADAEAVWAPYVDEVGALVERAFENAAPEAAWLLDAGARAAKRAAADKLKKEKEAAAAAAKSNTTDSNETDTNSTEDVGVDVDAANATAEGAEKPEGEEDKEEAEAEAAADEEDVPADTRPAMERLKEAVQSIELFGGTTRVPMLQNLLTEKYGSALKRQLNTDEAAVMGCAYIAAQMSSGFRVRAFTANVSVAQRVTFSLTDEEGSTTPKTLFRPGAKMVRKAVVSNRTRDFNVSLYLTPTDFSGQDVGTPTLVAQYELRGISTAFSAWRNSTIERGDDPDLPSTNRSVRMQFDLNATGMVSLALVEARLNEMVEFSENKTERVPINDTEEEENKTPEEKEKEKAAEGAEGDADAAPAAEGAESDGAAKEGEEGEGDRGASAAEANETESSNKTSTTPKKKKPKRKFKTVWKIVNGTKSTPRSKKIDFHRHAAWWPLPMSKKDILLSKRKAQRFNDREALKAATGAARNSLESLLYESRGERGLENELLAPFFEDGDREKIETLLSEISDWLDYGEGSDATTPDPFKEQTEKIYAVFKGPLDRYEADAAEKKRVREEEELAKREAEAAAAAAAGGEEGVAAGGVQDDAYYENLEKIYREYGLDPQLVQDLRKPKASNLDDLLKQAMKDEKKRAKRSAQQQEGDGGAAAPDAPPPDAPAPDAPAPEAPPAEDAPADAAAPEDEL